MNPDSSHFDTASHHSLRVALHLTWVCPLLAHWSRLPCWAGHAQAGPLGGGHAREPGTLCGLRSKNSKTKCLCLLVTSLIAPLDSHFPIHSIKPVPPSSLGRLLGGCPRPSHSASPGLHLLIYFQGLSQRRNHIRESAL